MAYDHLTEDEILDYLKADVNTSGSMELVPRVIGHVMNCAQCREQLRLYQDTDEALVLASLSQEEHDTHPKSLRSV